MALPQRGKQLRELFARKNTVTSVFGCPNALHARIMEAAGIEALFVGGAGTTGNYTGFSNTSMASMTELVAIGGFVARACNIPVLLDGDTGPGSLTALERMVEDAIRNGLAGVRFEDQPAGRKRQSKGDIDIIPRDEAVARYRVACAARDRLDPTFVIACKTYARNANGGGLQEGIDRLNLYREAGVDSLHFQSAHNIEEVKEVRRKVKGNLAMIGAARMSLQQHVELGIDIAWFTRDVDEALRVACWELCQEFRKDGVEGIVNYEARHADALAAVRALAPLSPKREGELEKLYWADSPSQ